MTIHTRPPLAFLDLETGGLDEEKHAVVEVAVCVTDGYAQGHVSHEWLVRAVPGRVVEPEALALHGLDGSRGLSPDAAYREIASVLDGKMLAGWNLQFDLRFLRQLSIDVGEEWLSRPPAEGRYTLGHYHKLDVSALAVPAWLMGRVESLSLGKVARKLGVPQHLPEHRAMTDCLTTMAVYRHFLARGAA